MQNQEHINEEFETLEELHHNNLDDIVLKNQDKKAKLKRYALIGGAFILVFLIVFYIVKMVTDSSAAPQDRLIEEQTTQSEPSDGFEEIPILSEENVNTPEPTQEKKELDSVVQEVLNKEQKLAKEAVAPQTKPPVQPKPTPPAKNPTPKAKPATITKSVPKKVATQHKATKKSTHRKVDAHGSYYIQVGAFLKYDPDKSFLAKIKRAGYNYVIKEFHINGKRIKRVYIGPYTSKSSAIKQLRTIKRTIASNAFVTKVR